jgi:outer membrane receptor protein involved in Fe transport
MQERGWRKLFVGLVLAIAALLFPRIATAQTGKITGVVTDAGTGQPVEGAQVFIQGTGLGAVTGGNGRYFILSVQPGTYTVTARRIGFQSVEVAGVNVAIDVTRELNFRLNSSSTVLQTQRIVAEAAPLVERGLTGSSTTITADVIQNLPVTNIAGVLSLQQGFTAVPQNTSLLSLAEETRATVQPIRVRGGRGGATVALIDGIPINNPLFGQESISLNPLAVSAVDFTRGYMEPQYGNGLSGVINQALREGGTQVAGSLDYQNSSIAGAFGSKADELRGYNLFRGFLGGPVPGTDARLRYMVSGQLESGAAQVLEFDNDITSFTNPQRRAAGQLGTDALDIISGWRAFGGRQNQQFLGKLTFLPFANGNTKINATVIDQQRQAQNYDRRYLLAYAGDPWARSVDVVDSLGFAGQRNFRDILQTSVRDETRMYVGSLQQRFGRTSLNVSAARMEGDRESCNLFLGVCINSPFTLANFRETFWAPFAVAEGVPFFGSGNVYGGEDYSTNTIRADVQSQVTDHHNLQVGAWFVQHDIEYNEVRALGGNSGLALTVPQLYRAKPREIATYLQDRIEYDFLTVRLGFRYDYGKAEGRGFADPQNPTNGTTARDICESQFGGVTACTGSAPGPNGKPILLDSAARLAQLDDFKDADARTAFSPRIGVSFPLTERSQIFFNAGRYTMNPLYANVYRNTGIGVTAGTVAEGGDAFCRLAEIKPGTTECVPPLAPNNPDYIGNPNLKLEEATQYEVGYAGEFGRAYAVNVAIYNRDETGLSGLRRSRAAQDIGTTYAGQATPSYFTIVNQDFLTARGVEVQFRRRLTGRWGYDLNYGWSRATTNSPPPDRAFEVAQGGEANRTALREVLSDIDQTHRANATLQFGILNDVPQWRFGNLLRQTNLSVTYRFASGFPYTPIRGETLGAILNPANVADINAGRSPSTQQVDLLAQKSFDVRNLRYGLFVRVDNLLDRKNCVQVFVNTGNCESGLRDPINRRVGNFEDATSTSQDQPEYIGARRSIFTGLSLRF